MLTFIFNDGLETEKSIQFNSFNEILGVNRMNASREIRIDTASDIPDLSDFTGFTSFQTLKVVTGDGLELTMAGEYNTVDALNVSYFDDNKTYQINMSLSNK